MWCKHEWEVLDKTVLPSAFEQMKEDPMEVSGADTAAFFQKTVSLVVSCKKCGKLEHFVTVNP